MIWKYRVRFGGRFTFFIFLTKILFSLLLKNKKKLYNCHATPVILPGFGIISHVIMSAVKKQIFGYIAMVYACGVWVTIEFFIVDILSMEDYLSIIARYKNDKISFWELCFVKSYIIMTLYTHMLKPIPLEASSPSVE
jgi:hypothetical protein